jgi:hypothetical protein
MSSAVLIAKTVMDASAGHLNDINRSLYTYAVQIPYLRTALHELEEEFQLNEVPVVDTESTVIQVNAGVSILGFNTIPALPADLVEPIKLWESARGTNIFVPMSPSRAYPIDLTGISTNELGLWVWENQQIKFIPANANNDVRIEYRRNLFTSIIDENSSINVINAQTYLEYRNAALCAEFIAEDKERAASLNGNAGMALDRALGISVKTRQNIAVRRRPFRRGYKRRNG